MSWDQQLQDLWREIDDVAIELAQVRDAYIAIRGEEKRAARLTDDYSRLLTVETALYEYIGKDRSPWNEQADRLAYIMAHGAVSYAKSQVEWANEALQEGGGKSDAQD